MKYQDALNFLYSRVNYEAERNYSNENLGLDRIKKLLNAFKNPEREINSILIAGTNGKGSTAALLSELLIASGVTVGQYTSPHLVDIRERIKINNELMPKLDFKKELFLIKEKLDEDKSIESEGKLSFFEILTVSAILYFYRNNVDCAILEVGLGGRLDATNVVVPLLSIITSISLDHQKILGNTIRKIAREKGGIIKNNSLVISAAQSKDVREELINLSNKKKTKIIFYKNDFKVSNICRIKNKLKFDFDKYKNLVLNQLAKHQIENAVIAIKAYCSLSAKLEFQIKEKIIRATLRNFKISGRMQVISRKPLTVLDGAHNIASVSALVDTLNEVYREREKIIIFSAMCDKDIDTLLIKLSEFRVKKIIFFELDNARALRVREFKRIALKIFSDVKIQNNFIQSYEYAKKIADKKDLIVVVGSLYLVGKVINSKII